MPAPRCLLLTRGTGAAGIHTMRSSDDGVYGPGVYFYAGPAWHRAATYAERGGGVIVATARLEHVEYKRIVERGWFGEKQRGDIAVVHDPSRVRVLGVIPTEKTLDRKQFATAVKRIARKLPGAC